MNRLLFLLFVLFIASGAGAGGLAAQVPPVIGSQEEEDDGPIDAEDSATAIDLGGFAGVTTNAPVRSIFNLVDVGVLLAGVQAERGTETDKLNIARDAALPISRETDATVNFRKFAYSFKFAEKWRFTVHGQYNTFRELTRTAGPAYETPGYQLGRPERADGGAQIAYGNTFRVWLGYTGDRLETPLTRMQAGRIGYRVGRGRMSQILEGGEIGFGFYPVLLKWVQFYGKISLGGGTGKIRYALYTLGRSDDPRTDEELADPNVDLNEFVKADYFEIVRGKMELQSLYGIAEAGIFIRLGSHLALRLGGFYQGHTYQVPGVRGNLYVQDLQTNSYQLTPLDYVPTSIIENADYLEGATFALVLRF